MRYNKLWFRLAEKGLKKKDLQNLTGLSSATIAKLAHNQTVSLQTLQKICHALNCDLNEIMDTTSRASTLNLNKETSSSYLMNSFFSGIGGFDIAFERQGFKTAYLCEINDYCNKVLSQHWPNVDRGFDINEVNPDKLPFAEVWCGGFPCQDISLARGGKRMGLKGARSGLFYQYADLVEQRRPRVVILENVAGLLSSNHGHDFGVILHRMTSMGYSVSWRLLNTRYFGAPQSRPRMYLCCWLNSPMQAVKTLFDQEGAHACTAERLDFITPSSKPSGVIVPKVSYCLAATSGRHTGTDWSRTYVVTDTGVRRMTPLEYERLQGFPDQWTQIDSIQSDEQDTLRYTALGNAVSVPVVEWIASKLQSQLDQEYPDRVSFDDIQSLIPEFLHTSWNDLDLDEKQLMSEAVTYKWPKAGIAWKNKYIGGQVPPSPAIPIASDLGESVQGSVDDKRYYLTPNAAEGILRRVNSQNRKLFPPLYEALEKLSAQK